MTRVLIGILLLLVVPLATGLTEPSRTAPDRLTDAEKIYGLALFWQEVNYNFVYFDQVPDLNWDSTFKAFIPQVLATRDTYEYYRTMQRFAALLKDGHTGVTMPERFGASLDRPKIGLAEVHERIYVTNVDTSLKETIPIGSEIIAVDKTPTAKYMATEVFPYYSSSTRHWLWYWCGFYMLLGPRDTPVELTYSTPAGDTDVVTLTRNRTGLVWDPHLKPRAGLTDFRWEKDSIACIALSSFQNDDVVDSFLSYLPQMQFARALIIDLRDNGGGSTGIGAQILSHFTTDTLIGSTWKTHEYRGAFAAWGRYDDEYKNYANRNAWYEGSPYQHPPADSIILTCPVAVLIGHSTASAAEDFLIMCDRLDNVTLVGAASNGSTGQPLVFDLPGGGWARVCSKRDTYPDGRDFVGVGVQPDILVEPSLQDVLTGNDIVLERAIGYLDSVLTQK